MERRNIRARRWHATALVVAGALLSVSATAVELTLKPNRPGIYVIEPGPWHSKIVPAALATLPALLDQAQIKHLQGFFVSLDDLDDPMLAALPPYGEWQVPVLADRKEFLSRARAQLMQGLVQPHFPRIADKCPGFVLLSGEILVGPGYYKRWDHPAHRVPDSARLRNGELFVGYPRGACRPTDSDL